MKTLEGNLAMLYTNIIIFAEEKTEQLIKPLTNKSNCLVFQWGSFQCYFTLILHLTIISQIEDRLFLKMKIANKTS